MTLVNVVVVATGGAAVAATTTLSVAHPLSQLRRPVAANGMNKCYIYAGCILSYETKFRSIPRRMIEMSSLNI